MSLRGEGVLMWPDHYLGSILLRKRFGRELRAQITDKHRDSCLGTLAAEGLGNNAG